MGEVGRRWRRILHDEAVFGGPGEQKMFSVPAGQMYSVAVGGPGLVAVGRDLSEFASVVWVSADGLEWQRHFVGRTFNESQMRSVAVGGPGLVAVGSDGRDFRRAAVWVSSDAFDWQRLPHNPRTWKYAEMRAVVVGGQGLVAVGWDEGGPAVWVSP